MTNEIIESPSKFAIMHLSMKKNQCTHLFKGVISDINFDIIADYETDKNDVNQSARILNSFCQK